MGESRIGGYLEIETSERTTARTVALQESGRTPFHDYRDTLPGSRHPGFGPDREKTAQHPMPKPLWRSTERGRILGRGAVRRTIVIAVLLACPLLLSCGAGAVRGLGASPLSGFTGAPDFDGELVVRPDAGDRPSLELRFPFANERSTLGWSAVHMWARPHQDHVGVTALVDAPAEVSRWTDCEAVHLRIDSRVVRVDARYVGRPMDGSLGVYDAVQLSLDVLTLRKMANARTVTGVACGDPFEITRGQQDSLRRFVEWFDSIATPGQLREAPWYRDVGPRVDLLPLEIEDETPLEG